MEYQTDKNQLYQNLGSISVAEPKEQVVIPPTEPLAAAPFIQPPHHHNWHHTPLALVIVVSVITVAGGLFFSVAKGSLAHIQVANQPVHGNISQLELEKKITTASKDYTVKVKYVDGSVKKYSLAETGVSVDAKKSADKAHETISNSLVRRLQWWQPIIINLVTKTDKKKIDTFVTTGLTVVKVAPVDATLSLVDGTATITPDTQGSGSGIASADKAVASQVSRFSADPLKLKPMKLPVAIKAKDLESSKTKAETILNKQVVFNIAGHSVTATPADISGWIEVTPVPKDKTADVTVNSGKVLQYIDKVAGRYVTLPRSRLVSNTSTGQVVLDNGADGVDVVSKDQTAASVASKLTKDPSLNVDLAVQYTAAKTVEADVYPKWFVADTTNKRMYAYEGTNLVRTFLVSAGAPATPTVTGQYKIYAKYASQDMTGNNADGSRYFQPAVPYVNYFTGGYAIHGNYWRPASYFGNINSSHGCIGINVDDAAWIYDWAPIGTPVIVHR